MKGTELAAGAAKMHLRQLRPHPVALPEAEFSPRQKLLFSRVPGELRSLWGSGRAAAAAGAPRDETWPGNGKTRKPSGFQVKQCLWPRTQRGADTSCNAPERGKPGQGVQEDSQDFP